MQKIDVNELVRESQAGDADSFVVLIQGSFKDGEHWVNVNRFGTLTETAIQGIGFAISDSDFFSDAVIQGLRNEISYLKNQLKEKA